jgi:hypothetical protein
MFNGWDEIIRHGAANAPIGEFDNIIFWARFDPARAENLAVHADVTEFIDD